VLVERLARERGVSVKIVQDQVRRFRDEYARNHGGAVQSLGNTFVALGVPIQTSVEWREQLIHPEDYLSRDERLRRTLEELATYYALAAVTNNPVKVGVRTLEVLGVSDLVQSVIGLDSTGTSKPNTQPFRHVCAVLDTPPLETISVGDRMDVDIVPAREIGMGAILVDGVEDVYQLPAVLRNRRQEADQLETD